MQKGLIQIYTGDGKGKSTAAFGLAIRAAGRKNKVTVIQFLKGNITGELLFLEEHFPAIEVFRFHSQKKFTWNMNPEELALLKKETLDGFELAKKIIRDGSCDLLILDEFLHTMNQDFIEWSDAQRIFANRPQNMEIVLTGRNASAEMIEFADLVTEMKKIKHPFDKGIDSRVGIEN